MNRLDRMLDYIRTVAVPAVRAQGWHVHGHVTDGAGLAGNITYTVGLTEARLPELAVTGLPHEIAAVILNDCARTHLVDELEPGRVYHSAGGTRLLAIDAPGVVGPLARSMYGRRVRFVQLLWADRQGLFPTSPAWQRDRTRPGQPVCDQPLPADCLPAGDGVVGHMDEVADRRLRRPDT